MTTTELEPAPAQLQQPIQFSYEDDSDGFVAATIPLTWKFDEDTIGYIAENRHMNPYLLIIVASTSEHTYDTFDRDAADEASEKNPNLSEEEYDALVKPVTRQITEYSTTSVQAIPLLNNAGQPNTSKAFVSFDRSGDNVIVGRVVTVFNAHAMSSVRQWMRNPHNVTLSTSDTPGGLLVINPYEGYSMIQGGVGTSLVNVQVPQEMFAKEPSAAAKSLVRQFFRGREDDQCHFRKRMIASVLLSIPVQLYGLVVRFGTLLFALLFASRGMVNSKLFALNPHDYARSLGASRWLKDEWGDERSTSRQLLSPVGLVTAAIGLATIWLPGEIFNTMNQEVNLPLEGEVAVGLAFWISFVVFTLLCWVAFSRKGHRWFAMNVGYPVERFVVRLFPARKEQAGATHSEIDRTVEQLREMQTGNVAPSQVANTTFKLKFSDLKMKVCKPFAKPAGNNR